jgi:LysM repeat protein
MPVRRMLPFILLNILVSAAVVLAILYWWDGRGSSDGQSELAALDAPLPTLPAAAGEMAVSGQPDAEPEAAEEASGGPEIYTVKPGDTLGSISREFDIAMQDIMEANGITDPNFLQVGQQLILPGNEPEPTAEPEEAQGGAPPVPTPIDAVLPSGGEAVVEIGEVTGANVLLTEAVSIVNSGQRPVALLGWRLEDEDGHVYTFGQVTLFGEGAAIRVHTRSGQEGPADLYWGQDEAVWQPGETATLVNAGGQVQDTYIIGD